MLDNNPITLTYNVFKGNKDLLRAYWDLHKNAGLLGLVVGIALAYFRAPDGNVALKVVVVLMSGVGLVAIAVQALEQVFAPFLTDAINLLYPSSFPSGQGEMRFGDVRSEFGKRKMWKFRGVYIPLSAKSIALTTLAAIFLFGVALFVVTIASATSLEIIKKLPNLTH